MEIVKLKVGRYSLSRVGDGAGDSGLRLESLKWPEGRDKIRLSELIPVGENGEVHVGCRVECGSIVARSYSASDFWLTTEVTEILDTTKDEEGDIIEAKFKTSNSEYIVKVI